MNDEKWRRLKEYLNCDLKMCEQEEARAKREGEKEKEREWYMAKQTDRQTLDEMARLEKQEAR